MNILLTGANGFLGSHLLKTAVQHHNVFITLRAHSNITRIEQIIRDFNIPVLYTDSSNEFEIESFFDTNEIEMIIHCATDYGRQEKYFHRTFETNVLFPLKLIEIGLSKKLKYFINTDSYFNKDFMSYNALPKYSKTKKLWKKSCCFTGLMIARL